MWGEKKKKGSKFDVDKEDKLPDIHNSAERKKESKSLAKKLVSKTMTDKFDSHNEDKPLEDGILMQFFSANELQA